MKKGIIGAVIGLLVFFFATNIIFINGGFTLGFTAIPFVVIGVFIFVVSRITRATKENNQSYYHDDGIKRSTSTHCVNCNVLISSQDKYCPECGTPQKDTIICEYCGHENPKSNALCENCNGFL